MVLKRKGVIYNMYNFRLDVIMLFFFGFFFWWLFLDYFFCGFFFFVDFVEVVVIC